ncbi:MAG: tandem-95 repeat protein [Candidatus Bipolaricaulia bacterium]
MTNLITALRRPFQAAVSVAALALLLVCAVPFAQAQDVRVRVNDTVGSVGDTVAVDIQVENLDAAADFNNYGIDEVSFSGGSAEPAGYVTEGTITGRALTASGSQYSILQDTTNGRVGVFGGQTPLNEFADGGSGTLITLLVAITGTGEASATLENLAFNSTDPPGVTPDPVTFDVLAGDNILSIPDTSATSGQRIVVPIRTTNLTEDLESFGLDINYDETALSFQGLVNSDNGVESVISANNFTTQNARTPSPGLLRVGAGNAERVPVDGSRPLTYLEFTVVDRARSELDFVESAVSVNGSSLSVGTKDGSVDARNAAPFFSNFPGDTTIDEDSQTDPLSFSVDDNDDPVSELSVTKASSNADLVPEDSIEVSGSGADRTVTVTPSADSNGTAEITLAVSDGTRTSTQSFTLTVDPVRDAPIAVDDSYSVPDGENDTLNVSANMGVLENDRHPDDAFNQDDLSVNTQPIQEAQNGTVAINANGSFQYVPEEDFDGTDSFKYEVTDGDSTDTATVTIEVAPDPVAKNDTYETTAGVTASLPAEGPTSNLPTDSSTLHTAQLTALQTQGNVGFMAGSSPGTGNARVTLVENDAGEAVLNYQITLSGLDYSPFASEFDSTDALGDDVVGFHFHGPAASGETAGVLFGIVGTVVNGAHLDASATDDQDRQVTVDNQDGTVRISGTWDPDEGAVSPSSLADEIADADVGEEIPLYLNLHTESNPKGEIRGQIVKGPAVAGVLANDEDASGDELSVSVVENVSNGSLTLNSDGSFTYTPNDGFTGQDSFTYLADDGDQATDQASVTINVEPVNDPPFFTSTAPQDTVDAFVNQTLQLQFNADPGDQDDSVGFGLRGSTPNASVDTSSGAFTFTPSEAQGGSTFTFEVVAEDEDGLQAVQRFDVKVNEVLLGDVTANGAVSAFDATRVLQAAAGMSPPRPLSQRDSTAADVSKDGSISSFDASAILRFVTGDIDSFSEIQNNSSKTLAAGSIGLSWGQVVSKQSGAVLPVRLETDGSDVFSVEIEIQDGLNSVVRKQIATSLPDGWQVVQAKSSDGGLTLAMAGTTPLTESQSIVRLPLERGTAGDIDITAVGSVNEGETTKIGATDGLEAPDQFALLGNYPNPVKQNTSIKLNLPSDATVQVAVYDLLGRQVLSASKEDLSAGTGRTVQLRAGDLSSGVYVFRVKASSGGKQWTDSGRMIVTK